MKESNVNWRVFTIYMFVLLFMLFAGIVKGQIVVTHFNAAWNEPNKVSYIGKLTDCEIVYVDIAASPKLQAKHEIVVVPTVVIFKDGEEIKRYQADLSFKLLATRKEIQSFINEQIMSDF